MLIGAFSREEMSEEQGKAFDAIAAGPRQHVPYPFLAMLDAPALAEAIQSIGAALRFSGALGADLREVAILAAAGAFGSGYEWRYHLAIARDHGVSAATIEAARTGETENIGQPEAAIIDLCWSAVRQRRIPLDQLETLASRLGRQAATEVVAIAGYYPLLALFLSAGELDLEPIVPT